MSPHIAPATTPATRARLRPPTSAAVGLLATSLLLTACAGDSIPGGQGGGTSGGQGGSQADPLPTTDDVLGLPQDAFDSIDWYPGEALHMLDSEGLTLAEVEQLEADALAAEPDGLPVALHPEMIRVYYSDDSMDEGEFGELQEAEWLVGMSDGTAIAPVAFAGIGEPPRAPLTAATPADVPADVLAQWELTASEAAQIALGLEDGRVVRVGIPEGLENPMVTVVVEREDRSRTRVTIDAVSGDPLNVVELES
jgi:hypothetical protein